MTMPLPVRINLQQTILRNTSNTPCDIDYVHNAVYVNVR